MRRLIIGNILSGNLIAILRVLHQGCNPAARGIWRAVNPNGLAVSCPYNQFISPVPENISGQSGWSLGGIASIISVCGQ